MLVIAIAVSLAHQRFGAIVLALDKAVAEAGGQEGKEVEDFAAPGVKGGERLHQFGWPLLLDAGYPGPLKQQPGFRWRTSGAALLGVPRQQPGRESARQAAPPLLFLPFQVF